MDSAIVNYSKTSAFKKLKGIIHIYIYIYIYIIQGFQGSANLVTW